MNCKTYSLIENEWTTLPLKFAQSVTTWERNVDRPFQGQFKIRVTTPGVIMKSNGLFFVDGFRSRQRGTFVITSPSGTRKTCGWGIGVPGSQSTDSVFMCGTNHGNAFVGETAVGIWTVDVDQLGTNTLNVEKFWMDFETISVN